MAATADLASVLKPFEIETISITIKEKIDTLLDRKQKTFNEISANYERLRVDSEQKYFDLEKQLITANGRLETEAKSCSDIRERFAELEHKYNETSQKLREFETTQHELSKTKAELELSNKHLTSEKDDLTQLLERKNREIDRLNDEVKETAAKFTEASKAKYAAQAMIDEVRSEALSAQYREKRIEQEKSQLENQISWLNSDLKEKTAQLVNFRKDHSSRLVELQSQLDLKTDELKNMEETVETFKKSNEDQAAKIENYIQKLKELRDFHVVNEEQFRNEITAQEKLVSLYKSSSEDSDEKVQELTAAVEELQRIVKEAIQANNDQEAEKTELGAQYEAEIKEKDQQLEKMGKELNNANQLIEIARSRGVVPLSEEAVEALSPSAAAASKLLKSGMTLTQIYSEYVETLENIHQLKEENATLSQNFNTIVQDLEEKAPLMLKQREDYEQALESVNHMSSQLDAAMMECEKLRIAADEARRKADQGMRDNKRLQQKTVDLGQQVRMLLKELEEARGSQVITSHDVADSISSPEISSSSSKVISEKLVTFRDIAELQEKNQQLLEVVRTLSEEREEQEKEVLDKKTAELKRQLDASLSEMEELKQARERQTHMVESIVRQRDMYRVLLQQTGSSPMPSLPITSTPMPPPADPTIKSPLRHQMSPQQQSQAEAVQHKQTLDETKNALVELQEEFSLYRREKGENEKMLNSSLETFRQECSELKLQNSKLASQLDFASERYKILQTNAEGYKKEISALRDKSQKMSESVIKHEQTINTLRVDLMSLQERATRAEVLYDNMKAERDLLKSSEQRLQQEKEALHREQRTQGVLLANLNAIQNNLERAEFEAKHKYNAVIENLQQENASLKKKLENIEDSHKTNMKDIEGKLNEARQQIEADFQKQRAMQQELLNVNSTIDKLKQQLSDAEAKTVAAEERLSNISQKQIDSEGPSMEAELRDLTIRLGQVESENAGLKEQLQEARRHANQYKEIASSIEQNLQEQNQTSKEFQETTESKLTEAEEERDRIRKHLDAMEKERADMLNENIRLSEESHKMNADLRKQLMEIQNELQNAVQRREEAVSNEKVARAECNKQLQLAQECQEKYERELLLHASDVEQLTHLKKEAERFSTSLAEVQEDAHNAKEVLELSQESWAQQESQLKSDCAKLESRAKELQKQNQMLHAELETMSEQMLALQEKKEIDVTDSSATIPQPTIDEASKSPEQMLEVLRFLRREKEIAEARLEVIQAEYTRNKQRADSLERELEEVNRTLSQERQNAQVSVQTAAEHAELMRKVENLNLLSDSNKLLRDEKDKLQQQLREQEVKARKLEDDLLPLRENNLHLTSQLDSVAADKVSLQAEVDRWKARTNHLIEQCNKADPEELKRLMSEKEELRKQLAGSSEQIYKSRAEISQFQQKLNVLQNENTELKQKISKYNEDNTNLKTELDSKSKDAEEKLKTITQLRKIGRKYRLQAEETQKELEETRAKMTAAASQNQTTALTEKLQTSEKNLAELTERLAMAEMEKNSSQKAQQEQEAKLKDAETKVKEQEVKVKDLESKIAEEESKFKDWESKLASLTEQNSEANEKLKLAQDVENKLKEENADLDKKQTQSRNILQTAKAKLTSQKDQIEKLISENSELRQKLSNVEENSEESSLRSASINSQYEEKINKLEKELAEARSRSSPPDDQTNEKLTKENQELIQKVQQLQKLLENKQKQMGSQQPKTKVTATPVERVSSVQSETPPTANIRPMATPSGSSRQGTSIQQGPSSRDATRAMASIKPMAVAPMPTASPSQTPTATVMPTTVTVQDMSDGDSMSPAHSSSTPVRPRQQVQPISPHIEEASPWIEEAAPTQAVVELDAEPAAESTADSAAGPAAARESHQMSASKRPREDDSKEDQDKAVDSPQLKRTKVVVPTTEESTEQSSAEVPPALEQETPTDSAEDTKETKFEGQEFVENLDSTGETAARDSPAQQEDAGKTAEQTVDNIDQSEESRSAETAEAKEERSTTGTEEAAEEEEQQTHTTEEEAKSDQEEEVEEYEVDEEEIGEDDVIVVDSGEEDSEEYEEEEEEVDEDDFEEIEEGMEDYEEAEHEEEDDEEDVEEGSDYDHQQQQDGVGAEGVEMDAETYDDTVEAMQEGEQEDDDENDVVIVDDEEENEAAMESQEEGNEQAETPGSQQAQQTLEVPRNQPAQLSRVPPRTERLPSGGRTQQLTPFVIGSQPGAFEDGDDSIVPSTPTLFVPRRNDDFAEAVSSPHVPPHARFVFGSGGEGGLQPELAQLGSQGGMDDTRMDLSQFDEGTGRSVPSTPLTTAPPIIVTEAPPPEQETQQSQEQQPPEIVISAATPTDSVETSEGDSNLKSEEQSQPSSESTEMSHEEKSELGQGEAEESKEESSETATTEMQQEKASTSESQERPDTGSNRPRIQRIVWDESGASTSGSQAQQMSSPMGSQMRGKPPTRGQVRGQPSQRSRGQTAFRSRPMHPQFRGQSSGRGTAVRGRGSRGRGGMNRPPQF